MPIDHQKWGSMAEQDGAPSFDLYLDDSGTRCPFKPSRPTGGGMDWFALGGLLLKSEDRGGVMGDSVAGASLVAATVPRRR